MSRPGFWRRLGLAAATSLLFWLALPTCTSAFPSFQEVKAAWRPSEAYLLDRQGRLIHELRIDFKVRRLPWAALEEMSPALIKAIIAAEDRRFYQHQGVDWQALAAAALYRATGKPSRGASTLTMQLAAMLDKDLAPTKARRGVLQKLAQLRSGLALEETWSKREIMEAYLNLVGFRGELQGIAAAARALFGKQPSGLSEAEAVLLAAILPSPNADAARIGRKACAIAKAGPFQGNCADLNQLAEDVLSRPLAIDPSLARAPHLARQLLKSPGESVMTTLDGDIQRVAGLALQQQLHGLSGRNVRDGAALVVDNASGDILAYVGSAGPFSNAAKVDGVRAHRQAGSTLKPFLYGLALEKQYLTAASILDDAPLNLATASGLYIPQNYDHDFKGLVSVRTALASSLNIPAVRALVLIGVERFRDRLRDLGYRGIREAGEYYGFSLALGSAEVTLLEQVNAYRTLANGGAFSRLRFIPTEPGGDQIQVMSEQAAFIVSDILSDRAGRAVTFGLDNPLATRFWSAVKTGTSKDMRDNWCIGFTPTFTVGVWVGNFEGDSMRDVSGVTGAAPVWLEIMSALQEAVPNTPPEPPAGIVNRSVRFQPAIEPERPEWFVQGTETQMVQVADRLNRSPKIESPSDGVIIALDPDIPDQNQAVLFTARPLQKDARFMLDGEFLASAGASHPWRPQPGAHKLELVAANGKIHHAVSFTVRGLNR